MKAKPHIYASITAGGTVYLLTESFPVSVSCLLSGILLDTDHLLDFFVFANEWFAFKTFFAWHYEVKWNKIYLVFHSYELYAFLAIIARLCASDVLVGVLLGMGLHLLMDQIGNKGLSKWFYFLIYRYNAGFKKTLLMQ